LAGDTGRNRRFRRPVLQSGWEAELLLFAACRLVSVYAEGGCLAPPRLDSELPTSIAASIDFVGKSYVLQEPIVDGRGGSPRHHDVDVRGLTPRGARIRVTGVDGLKLKVEPV